LPVKIASISELSGNSTKRKETLEKFLKKKKPNIPGLHLHNSKLRFIYLSVTLQKRKKETLETFLKRKPNNAPKSKKIPLPLYLLFQNPVFERPKSKGVPKEKIRKER
jgi:hypothetical protein